MKFWSNLKAWQKGAIVGAIWGLSKVRLSILFPTIFLPIAGALIGGFFTFILTSDIKSLKKATILGAIWGVLSSIGALLLYNVSIPFRKIVFLPYYLVIFLFYDLFHYSSIEPYIPSLRSFMLLAFFPISIPTSIISGIGITILISFVKERIKRIKPQFLLGFSFIITLLLVSNFVHAYSPTNHSRPTTSDDVGILSANEPYRREIIADGPWRIEPAQAQVPIYVLVKDAAEDTENPAYYLDSVEIWTQAFRGGRWIDDRQLKNVTYGIKIENQRYNLYENGDWYDVIMLDRVGKDVKNKSYTLNGEIRFHVKIKGRTYWLLPSNWDSYFKVYISPSSLPKLSNWYAGDTHYHSSYSDNFVEFGGPIGATLKMGKAIGLDWVTITDHSFDLDDVNQTRQTNDPNDKWNSLRSEVTAISDPVFKMILGEEVSAGNALGTNVHFLCYGLEGAATFIPGDGDDWWDHLESTVPTISLSDAISRCNTYGGVGYAAHPAAYDEDSARYLNRGNWTASDYALGGYRGLQIWNTITDNWSFFEEGMKVWVEQLLNGRRLFIAGGTDAHGDFSNASIFNPNPDVWGVIYHNSSFGRVRTYVYTTSFSNAGILNALKKGHSIITDGPLVVFDIGGTTIGDTYYGTEGDSLTLNITWVSTSEFGEISKITVIKGDIISKNETVIAEIVPQRKERFSGNKLVPITAGAKTYYRLNATTALDRKAFTNPIWVDEMPFTATYLDGYLYVGYWTSPGKIKKIRTSDMKVVGTLILPHSYVYDIINDGIDTLYAVTFDTYPQRGLFRINASNLNILAHRDFTATSSLAFDGAYLYVYGVDVISGIHKVYGSNLTIVGYLQVNLDWGDSPLRLSYLNNSVYIADNNAGEYCTISKVSATNLKTVAESNESNLNDVNFLETNGQYLYKYAGSWHYYGGIGIEIYSLGNLEILNYTIFPPMISEGQAHPFWRGGGIAFSNSSVYAATPPILPPSPAKIYKLSNDINLIRLYSIEVYNSLSSYDLVYGDGYLYLVDGLGNNIFKIPEF